MRGGGRAVVYDPGVLGELQNPRAVRGVLGGGREVWGEVCGGRAVP